MGRTVLERLDRLPRRDLTVLALKGLSTLVPGGWTNITNADQLIQDVIGDTDPALVARIRARADQLSRARAEGYGRALSLYDAVNRSQHAAGGLRVLANLSAGLPLLKRLADVTPPGDTLQAVDLSLKVGSELLAFTQVNGLPGDSFGDFGAALADYAGEARVRMAALICFDALLPLGDQALQKLDSLLGAANRKDLNRLPAYRQMAGLIPGRSDDAHLSFLRRGVDQWLGWAGGFVGELGLTAQGTVQAVESTLGPWQGRMDQFAAFLDAFTDTYAHTGVQAVARRLVERAAAEV
ncbi:hypothetical protein KQ302_10290 [Synechococcus sp. CS-602]|uniref:hypothetical protein n=1 Tax=unclassified Synechococcus TaxID=2626047 RepID=UPI0008FF6E9A|nr:MULTISPECIES: hypothetical protein [unclassified Synechococcus]APD49122.1 hypothetical protein BM449_13845 [Synechococcus sp. SynAce01]MCT0205484.1 hypothetical protein [Synechococcus sp. CS-602]MCT0246979.1 hypothetical protein [Synechococcus sp. CS-601]TWB91895.1 hypothetical protein FB106_10696 [Synechococcus sp. Ace-Pa]